MNNVSYQLYSSRNFGPFEQTLSMVSDAGYTQVEGYGALFSDAQSAGELKSALDANNLAMPTAHMGLAMLEEQPEEAKKIVEILGLKAAFVPFLSEDERPGKSAADWRAIGARAQKALAPLKEMGLAIGWHNHAFEMEEVDDGGTAMDAILAGGPDLTLELDLAWVVIGNKDPIEILNKYADRMTSVHVKDIAPAGQCEDEDGWADVGYGTISWAPIRDAVNASSNQFLVAEHDNPADDKRFASRSVAKIKEFWEI